MTERITLEGLYGIVKKRQEEMPEGSYVASLFRKGPSRIAQKVGEEGVEVALAVSRFSLTGQGRDAVIGETADLWFHSLVSLVASNITLEEVLEELTRRHAEKTK
ncbi:MAG: phosphoribosyl-ATP diphosphatase [Patescibacteria group bacterium]|nr:phosphoribosyl-ATP diphosphatase [Patescibacteria group bacterium]